MNMFKRLDAVSLLFVLLSVLPVTAQTNGLFPFEESVEELPPARQVVVEGLSNAINQSDSAAEVVRERHENRRIKTEREVVQDQDQNYINHGKWKMWDARGNVVMEGRYKHNERDGVWTRLYQTRETKLLNIAPFNRGQIPLVSQANFKDGKLHGKWVIYDAHKRKLSEWEFIDGKRHGRSTWWYLSGAKMREITYEDSTINGLVYEWDRTGTQVTKDKYVDGRRLDTKQETLRNKTKKSEGTVLYPQLVLDKPDDWLECTLATYTQEGDPVKHGVWTSWYPHGQRKLEGEYANDVPTGEFTWWHQNGQKSLKAAYRSGKKHGTWTWWHPNGLKSIQGDYVHDTPNGNWLWWNETGKVVQRADFNDPKQRQVLATPVNNELPSTPSVIKRNSARSSLRR